MSFELTDSVVSDIIFSMEDQGSFWFLDGRDCSVVSEEMLHEICREEPETDEESFFPLPAWTSDDGYELMEEFTNNLHAPGARADLHRALTGGRGVFRNFKNVLKSYPEVERKWYSFKEQRMRERVVSWYNGLRESWGLEHLESLESDEVQDTDELVLDDFQFSDYDFKMDSKDIERGLEGVEEEIGQLFSKQDDLGHAVSFLQRQRSRVWKPEEKSGIVCRTLSGDFTGCLLVSYCPPETKKTAVVTDFFVNQNYRGLGIGKALLSNCMTLLKKHGIRWILISSAFNPEVLEPLVEQFGFEKTSAGFVADLLLF
ncbi:MAG: GNAT family N-acetyltransferase [Treponema sp.]|nr:GNAT family N-acetyltransferase [Treponema sp.]